MSRIDLWPGSGAFPKVNRARAFHLENFAEISRQRLELLCCSRRHRNAATWRSRVYCLVLCFGFSLEVCHPVDALSTDSFTSCGSASLSQLPPWCFSLATVISGTQSQLLDHAAVDDDEAMRHLQSVCLRVCEQYDSDNDSGLITCLWLIAEYKKNTKITNENDDRNFKNDKIICRNP